VEQVYEAAVSREFPDAHEMSGDGLKKKYRDRKATSGQGSSSNNSGKPLRGTPPKGMPRRYRGKTTYR
jgi:hypothetical protein